MPYARDPETLARPWAMPGTPGLEHRIGGLEKADVTGTISYDPDNHDLMTRLRAAKVAGIANDIPLLEVDDPDGARRRSCSAGAGPTGRSPPPCGGCGATACSVAQAHLHYLNPFPRNTGEVLRRYEKMLVPEMNLGQLLKLVRAEFLVDAVGYNRVRGLPFKASRARRRRSRRWWSREGAQRARANAVGGAREGGGAARRTWSRSGRRTCSRRRSRRGSASDRPDAVAAGRSRRCGARVRGSSSRRSSARRHWFEVRRLERRHHCPAHDRGRRRRRVRGRSGGIASSRCTMRTSRRCSTGLRGARVKPLPLVAPHGCTLSAAGFGGATRARWSAGPDGARNLTLRDPA